MKSDQDTQEGLQQLYKIEPGYRTHDDAPDADEQAIKKLEEFIRRQKFSNRAGNYNKKTDRRWYS